MKYERGGKRITKFATITPKTYACGVQNFHKIEYSEFIKEKRVKYSTHKMFQ